VSWTGALDPALEVFNFGQGFPGDGEVHQIIGTKKKSQVDEQKAQKTLPIRLGRKSFEWMKLPSLFFNGFANFRRTLGH